MSKFNAMGLIYALTACLSKAGLAIGGTASKVKTAAPNGAGTDYSIDGVAYHKADTDDLFTLAGTISDGYTGLWLLCLNAAGTANAVFGTSKTTAGLAAGTEFLELPDVPAGYCPIGYVKVATAAADFVGGTTLLSAATATDVYVDLTGPLAVPLTS